jgi:hypothetical protein
MPRCVVGWTESADVQVRVGRDAAVEVSEAVGGTSRSRVVMPEIDDAATWPRRHGAIGDRW